MASVILAGSTFAAQEYLDTDIDGHHVQVIKVVLDWDHEIVLNAVDNNHTPKDINTLMKEVGGVSAINGWFFCPDEAAYSCEANTTQMIRIANGKTFSKRGEDIGENKAFFGITRDNKPIYVDNSTRVRENGYNNGSANSRRNTELDKVKNGMSMAALVKDGANVAIYNDEMNNDPKQWAKWVKGFICNSYYGETVYMGFVSNVTFSELAYYIAKNFGCENAIQLDSGGTRAMIVNGEFKAGPGRSMMDAFVVVSKNNTIQETTTASTTSTTTLNSPNPILENIFNKVDDKYSYMSHSQRATQYTKIATVIKLLWNQQSDASIKTLFLELARMFEQEVAILND